MINSILFINMIKHGKALAENALKFLGRVELKWNEALALVEVQQALHQFTIEIQVEKTWEKVKSK